MPSKTARLEARITADLKALVERAAAHQGRSVSEFVADTMHQAAMAVIQEKEVLRLNPSQSRRFVELLLRPARPVEALRRAARDYRRKVDSR